MLLSTMKNAKFEIMVPARAPLVQGGEGGARIKARSFY